MKKKALHRQFEFPFHITVRGNNREEFPCERWFAWKTFCGELYLQQILYGLRVHAFVMMPNHLHLLASGKGRKIELIMRDFLSSSTRIINHRARRTGRIFGGRYHKSLVADPAYFALVFKYVYRNPVKASLAENVADFPYSTYAGVLGLAPLMLQVSLPGQDLGRLIPYDPSHLDAWLNQAGSAELNEAVRKGLCHADFRLVADRGTRRKISLENNAFATPKDAGDQ